MLAQRHPRTLGLAVTVDEDGTEPLQCSLEHREGHRGGCIVERLERGQIVFVDVRKIQHSLYEGRRKVKVGYVLALHSLDDLGGIKRSVDHQGTAAISHRSAL